MALSDTNTLRTELRASVIQHPLRQRGLDHELAKDHETAKHEGREGPSARADSVGRCGFVNFAFRVFRAASCLRAPDTVFNFARDDSRNGSYVRHRSVTDRAACSMACCAQRKGQALHRQVLRNDAHRLEDRRQGERQPRHLHRVYRVDGRAWVVRLQLLHRQTWLLPP